MNRKFIYVIFTIILFALLFISSLTPVITRGEGREGLIVRALVSGESFILPLRYGTEIPSKPPLFHWIGFGLSKVTGEVGPMEIRAGSAVGTALLVVGTYLFFSIHAGTLVAILTTLILASFLEVMRYSTQARVDPLFAGVFSCAVFFIFSFYVGKGSRYLTGLGSLLFLVLSVLTKGPFGLILPVGVLLLYLLFRFESPDFRVISKGLLVFAGALLLSSIWYFLAYKIGGDRFLEVQLLKENAYRVVKVEGDVRGHEKPFYYTFIYLIIATTPWCLFLPRIVSGFNALKREGELKSNKLLLLSLAWASLFILAVFVSVSKRSVYFLPTLPALAYVISLSMLKSQKLVLMNWVERYERVLGVILRIVVGALIVGVVCALCLPFYEPYLGKLALNRSFLKIYRIASILEDYVCLVYLVVLTMVFRYLSSAFHKLRDARVEDAVMEISLSLILLFFTTQVLIASRVMSLENPEAFMRSVEKLLPKNEDIVTPDFPTVVQYKHEFYAPAFYLDRPMPVAWIIMDLNGCASKFCIPRDTYIFLAQSDLKDFSKIPHEVLAVSTEKLANRDEELVLMRIRAGFETPSL